jgi:hypothetical protein
VSDAMLGFVVLAVLATVVVGSWKVLRYRGESWGSYGGSREGE